MSEQEAVQVQIVMTEKEFQRQRKMLLELPWQRITIEKEEYAASKKK